MKILISGAAWHDNSVAIAAQGFQELGHHTEIFYDNPKDWILAGSKIAGRTPFRKITAKLEGVYRKKVGQQFLAAVSKFNPDFIFVIAGFRFAGAIIRKIRNNYKIPIANFVVDDPSFCSRTLVNDLSGYSELFVIDKSWMPVLEFFNPGRVHWMPHAADITHFKKLNIKKDIDIAFGGTMSLRMPNGPSGFLRAKILNSLAEQGFKITAYAGGITETFNEFPALRNIDYYDGYKNHDELNALYNRAKIVLSVHSLQLKSGVSPRIFDGAASGSFQLIEFKPELPELFPEGVKWFKNLKELVEAAKFYVSHNKEREEMAAKSYLCALKNHTFKNRAEYILKTMNL